MKIVYETGFKNLFSAPLSNYFSHKNCSKYSHLLLYRKILSYYFCSLLITEIVKTLKLALQNLLKEASATVSKCKVIWLNSCNMLPKLKAFDLILLT